MSPKVSRWFLLIAGILMIVLSIFMFTTPGENILSLALFISIAMLVSGISQIADWFCAKVRSGWMLAGGILTTLMGLWLCTGRGMAGLSIALPFLFGAWIMMAGITRTVGAFELKSLQLPNWGWVLTMGILGIVLGFLMLYAPLMAAIALGILIACLFLFEGVVSVVLALLMFR